MQGQYHPSIEKLGETGKSIALMFYKESSKRVDMSSFTAYDEFRQMGINSLDFVEGLVDVEDFYGIRIPDETAEEFSNIGDIVKYIKDVIPSSGSRTATDYDDFPTSADSVG